MQNTAQQPSVVFCFALSEVVKSFKKILKRRGFWISAKYRLSSQEHIQVWQEKKIQTRQFGFSEFSIYYQNISVYVSYYFKFSSVEFCKNFMDISWLFRGFPGNFAWFWLGIRSWRRLPCFVHENLPKFNKIKLSVR